MSESGCYIAYPASSELHRNAREFVRLMNRDNPKRQDALLACTMTLMVNETINVYLTDILITSGINDTRRKIIVTADSFLKKTARSLIKQVTKKVDAEQQRKTAEHIDSCLLSLKVSNNETIEWVAFPISESFYQKIISGHNSFLEHRSRNEKSIIIENQQAITHEMVKFLVDRLVSTINLGPILTKVIETSTKKCVQLMQSTLQKSLSAMEEDEIIRTNQHVAKMLIVDHMHNAMMP
ncbi:hypothetical protein A9Q99_18560 [Gammaproteobacteria bacterium 45_16_T64]|nr:hypothetical protein A9Q99_18560 [Gammaproteobacteria bacterium 45_16_T64]